MYDRKQTLDDHLSAFVSLAAGALAREDALLRGYLDSAAEEFGFYNDWPHGMTVLYERVLVYLIVRELIGSRFPLQIGWEQSYPGSPDRHADLAINVNGKMQACIECKVWLREDGGDIKGDLDKMAALPSDVRRFILVVLWNDRPEQIEDNVQWLHDTFGLRKVPPSPCTFRTRILRDGQQSEAIAAVALFEQVP